MACNTYENNTWTTSGDITYIYGDQIWIGRIGNYWDNYTGIDTNEDKIGGEAHNNDTTPLMEPTWKYKIREPIARSLKAKRGSSIICSLISYIVEFY